MKDWSKGKIYKIVNYDTKQVYYGSTIQSLKTRLKNHRGCVRKCCAINIMKGNYDIELVENFPCNSRIELFKRESYYIDNHECINVVSPYVSKEQLIINKANYQRGDKMTEYQKKYREEHREAQCEYLKKYYADNKDKRREEGIEKVTCACGCVIQKRSLCLHLKSKRHNNIIENL